MPYEYEIHVTLEDGLFEAYGPYDSWVAAYQAIPGMFHHWPELFRLEIVRTV